MKRLFASADTFLRESDWRDLALVKFCLFSIGLLAGLQVTERRRQSVRIAALAVFLLTYIPLMTKFLRILIGKRQKA
nr:permease of phosphate ABC transporter [uncultured Oscillibacter sp.]